MKAIFFIISLLFIPSIFAQYPTPQLFVRNQKVKVESQFDLAYGYFLRKYGKTYYEKEAEKTYLDLRNQFNHLLKTKTFINLLFAKELHIKEPVYLGLYEFCFSSEMSAKEIERILLKYKGKLNTSVVPDYFIFTRVKNCIFFVRYTNSINDKPIKALAHCLKTFQEKQTKVTH